MQVNLSINASSDSGWVQVFIDGKSALKKPGSTIVDLDSGHHTITYFARGESGDRYAVAITSPDEFDWSASGKLSGDHTTGQHGFTIN